MKEHHILETLLILLCMSTVAGFRVQIADAGIPSIVSVIVWTSGTHTMLNITITHSPPPTIGPSHYVSIIQVDINGTTTDLTQSPQSTITFVVTYDMGEVASGSTVRVRALCTVHGWSDWSNRITVSEYYLLLAQSNLVLQVVILALLVASYTFKRKSRFLSHGVLMLIALVLNLVSFAMVMGPSLISLEPVIMMSTLEKRSIVILLHATFGSVALVLAVFILASWRLRRGTSHCIRRKKVMRMAFMFWLIALLLGVLVYLLQYTDLFL